MAEKMNLDPKTIVDKEFDIDFKGYNPDQVDKFLDLVIKDYQTYEERIDALNKKLADMEFTNASLRAKLIDVEGRAKANENNETMLTGAGNVDILKRISRLENEVFKRGK